MCSEMPVLVRGVDDVEWVIEWKIQTENGYGVLVESYHPHRSINLCLVQTDKPAVQHTETLCSDREAVDVLPTRYCKPISISVSSDGISRAEMRREETPHMENWTVELSRYSFAPGKSTDLLSFVFSIKFKTGVSEMVEALKHMTDYFFLQQSHCDVQFCFPNDEQPIKAHVKILSSRSSVFAAMFQHDMQESKTGHVLIEDTERDIFYQLLHYIYSGRTWTSLTEGIAQKLLLAADKYNVTQLAKECTSFLISNIQWESAVDSMIWAHVHSIGQVKEAALDVVVKNGKQICPLDAWERLSINYPHLCLETTRRMMA